MSSNTDLSFADHTLPPTPSDEIPRDVLVNQIAAAFSPDCQQQMVTGGVQTGKTNVLAQFVRQHGNRCVSYFITSNPLSQRKFAFLYTMCCQLSTIIGTNPPPQDITLEGLENMFTALTISLVREVKTRRTPYYLVIDGLGQAAEGVEGERIIDLFPLQTTPEGPFLLFSCRSDSVHRLPESLRTCRTIEPIGFSRLETAQYLSDLGLPDEEILSIQEKYNGVPGYVRIIKTTKLTDPDFDLGSAPKELDRLINQQVRLVRKASEPATREALEVISVLPAPLPLQILAEMTRTDDESALARSLQRTGLVRSDPRSHQVECANDLVRESIKKELGNRAKKVIERLLKCVEERHPGNTPLLTLLYKEGQDYEGICKALSADTVIAHIDATGGISNIVGRLRIAAEMAREAHQIDDLAQWTLGIAAAKSFVSHAVSIAEVKALLSINETKDALSRAYAIPEPAIRIRLLARAYTTIKESGDRVPKSALDELATMARNLDLATLDKDIAQEVAIDLFPILPDVAFSLLEKVIGQSEKRTIVEVAIEAIERSLQEAQKEAHFLETEGQEDPAYIAQLLSSWLNGMTLPELLDELKSVENTKAKEFIIRQWCRQNRDNIDVAKAVGLWLDTVIGDTGFVVLLRSLRHISEVLIGISAVERKQLIDRIRAQGLMALDSPKEEWVRLHLNLAEALSEIDRETSKTEIKQVHQGILESALDLDIRAFCLARLWVTIGEVFPDDSGWIDDVHIEFQKAFSTLLDGSAEQLETTIGTLKTLADVDPTSALTEALDLNTHSRRLKAIQEVIGYTLRQHSDQDVASFLEDALRSLDERLERDAVLVSITAELNAREVVPALCNLETLLKYAREMATPMHKAQALGNLARMYYETSPDDACAIMKEAIEAWRKGSDLKARLSLGFALVEKASRLDVNQGRQLYDEVRDLKYQPGSALAIGGLGSAYKECLDLAIRSVNIKDLTESGQAVHSLEDLIARIPSQLVRVRLLAELAASIYRAGYSDCANDLVRTRVIPGIEQVQSDSSRNEPTFDFIDAVQFCLPVIFEYDFSAAKELGDALPYPFRDQAWYSTVLWSLCRSFLGDQECRPKDLRVKVDHPRFKTTIVAAREIDHDMLLCNAIEAITSSVKSSFDSEIDLNQVVDVLQQLEHLAISKLPEPSQRNIKHEGYLILAQARIHGARSNTYRRAKRHKQRLSPKDIGHRWVEIRNRAKAIPNVADRVFVMALIVPEMALYYRGDLSSPRNLLETANSQVADIPTLIDRANRLEVIADSWVSLRDKSRAEVVLEHAFDIARQLEHRGSDDRLRMLVQAAYKLRPELAEQMVSTLDARLPREMVHPTHLALEVERLRSAPSRVGQLRLQGAFLDSILSSAARKLLQDFAANRASVVGRFVLENWLGDADRCTPRAIIDVTHWVVENLYRKTLRTSPESKYNVFTANALLVYKLAKWISDKRGEGIPEAIYDSFPGLSTKVVGFRGGEVERAKKWLQDWLLENVEGYLKICDPYFGLEELEYLMYVPEDCPVLIVTTDCYLKVDESDPSQIAEELEKQWRTMTSRALPRAQLLIVPSQLEDTFHDRAIITQGSGLDVGPSLNRLGKKFQKVTVLAEEDARDLENTYVDRMLNNATWFMEGVHPIILSLGD